jgi:hypothetical protein
MTINNNIHVSVYEIQAYHFYWKYVTWYSYKTVTDIQRIVT